MNDFSRFAAASLGAWLTLCAAGVSQERIPPADHESPPSQESLGGWAMERVRLADGRELLGLIQAEDDGGLTLAEIHRPAGRPMYLVVRPLERAAVADVVRLDAAQRRELAGRIEQFVHRAAIAAGRMEAVALTSRDAGNSTIHRYRGKWFTLESTADADTSRRIVVRLEQIFTAYRQIIAPQTQPSRPLRLMVCGSIGEYHARLQQFGLTIDNRAVFLPEENLVLAGSELGRYREGLAAIESQHQRLRGELRQLEGQLTGRLNELARQMQTQGIGRDAIRDLLGRERRKAEAEIRQKQGEIRRCEFENERAFHNVSGQMLTRLGHEGLHAYLENWVWPRATHHVPPWLNEGLATMFEGGQLESGTLRLDAPNRAALRELKADRAGPHPLSLAELFAADGRMFFAGNRSYCYAWGVAYYLSFEKRLLGSPGLDQYVARPSQAVPPVERFERLVGMPLAEFERAWQGYLRSLK